MGSLVCQGAGIMAEADGMMVPPPPQGARKIHLNMLKKVEIVKSTWNHIYIYFLGGVNEFEKSFC